MKLFMFYVGGDAPGSNIELHDMRFAIGRDYASCFEDLRQQWWGEPKSLHLDGWMDITQVDGFDVTLVKESSDQPEQLFFLNMGGYDPDAFEEVHRNLLLVGQNIAAVQRRAISDVRRQFQSPHRDNVIEVEKTICLSNEIAKQGWHIQLTPTALPQPISFTSRYQKIA